MVEMITVQLLPIIISIIEVGMCYQFLYCTVLEKGYRNRQKLLIWVNMLLVGSMLGVNRGNAFFSSLMMGICILVTFAFTGCLIQKELLLTGSLVCIFYTGIGLMDFLIAFISMNVLQGSFAQLVYIGASYQWKSLIYIVSRVIIGVLIWLFSSKQEYIKQNLSEYKKIIALGCIALIAVLIHYQKSLDDMAFGFRDMHGGREAFSLACVLILMSMAAGIVFKYQAISRENDIIILKNQMLEYNYQKLQEAIEDKQILTHDMKNHLLVVENYVKNKECVKAEIYLSELVDELSNMIVREWTGNRILDFIINYKKKEAEELGIKMYVESSSLPPLPFSDNELCALFSNLLDNAIEACGKIREERKDIYLTLRYQRQMLYIECKNTCYEQPRKKNGRLVTTKKDKEIHGYGIKSMERIINRYEGRMTYCNEDEIFTVKISFFDLHYI